MRLRFVPQDSLLFDDLAEQGQAMLRAVNTLAELVGADDAQRVTIAAELADQERAGDELTLRVVGRLNSSFVTPFDRHDVHALTNRLDDCLDHLDATADLIQVLRVGPLPEGALTLVSILVRQAELTASAMRRLRRTKDLAGYWVEVNRLGNEADRCSRRLLARLLGGSDHAALKLVEVLRHLDQTVDAFEAVARTVEAIAVKDV